MGFLSSKTKDNVTEIFKKVFCARWLVDRIIEADRWPFLINTVIFFNLETGNCVNNFGLKII